jgi:hypothetical protein
MRDSRYSIGFKFVTRVTKPSTINKVGTVVFLRDRVSPTIAIIEETLSQVRETGFRNSFCKVRTLDSSNRILLLEDQNLYPIPFNLILLEDRLEYIYSTYNLDRTLANPCWKKKKRIPSSPI